MEGRALPPDVDEAKITWDPKRKLYTEDGTDRLIKPHTEAQDPSHWDHWDVINPGPPHSQRQWPANSGKLRPGQVIPRPGQSIADPWQTQRMLDRMDERFNSANWRFPQLTLPGAPRVPGPVPFPIPLLLPLLGVP